jgi:hypothetical protein
MEKELFVIQDEIRQSNNYLRSIRNWIAFIAIVLIIIPLALVVLSILGLGLGAMLMA